MSSREGIQTGDEIAVIGMAGRFPGAPDVDAFWRNLCQGVESVRAFTPEEMAASGVDPAALKDPGFVNAGVVLEEADAFDAAFFGYNPREAELMDPQHRLFLESAWTALEHAGYDPEKYPGLIGVYGGVARNNYFLENLLPRRELLDAAGNYPVLIANEKDFPATRASFKLDLRGPAMNIQSACSTSGVAIHLACQALASGECDMALAGAACVMVPLTAGYYYNDGSIQSADGHCRAFDAKARGTVMGSGVAFVVLKRLSEAWRDGDKVYALIKGTAINNDGAGKAGFTAPSVEGQARVIGEAQAMAGVSAESVSYLEAHGTGTPLGDPIEIAALTRAFRQSTNRKQFCAIGSLKTNIGHLDAAAGVAGVIKAVLALQHRQLPPSLNFEVPNPEIDFANSPFYVNTKLRAWDFGATPRRAGVSSFGLGGTNAHIILEEAPEPEPPGPSRPAQLLVLSARTDTALAQAASRLAAHLEQHPETNLADAAYTLQTGRRRFAHRRALVCRDAAAAVKELRATQSRQVLSQHSERNETPVVFMFPGQGAQQVNMARELFQSEAGFRRNLECCAEILKPHLGFDLLEAIYPGHDHDGEAARRRVNQTQVAQPAIFAVEYALAQLWMEWGVRPRGMIGHSVGEYVAACLAGVFSLEDILQLIACRGRLMQNLPGGSMLAASLTPEEAQPLLNGQLHLAAVNGKSNCVIAGPTPAVAELERTLGGRRVACRPLPTSHAFHSAMVEPVVEPFLAEFKKIKLHAPRLPFISSPTGKWITAEQATDPGYWARHLRETVRFHDGLQEIMKQSPGAVLLEVGPGELLSPLARRLARESGGGQAVVASLARTQDEPGGLEAILQALGKLWLEGVEVDWNGFYKQERRQRMALPTYPFERKRYWIDRPLMNAKPSTATTPAPTPEIQNVPAPSSPRVPRPVQSRVGRKEKIIAGLKETLHGLSGIAPETIAPEATFLSLGLDSLFLTQAGLAFQKKYRVNITLRQLLEEYSSIEALAAHIDASLPAETVEEPAPIPAPVAAPTQPLAAGDPQQLLASLLEQQLQLVSQQLAVLRGQRTVAAQPSAPAPAPRVEKEPEKPGANRWFGPFKPIDKGAGIQLDPRQEMALDELIARYTKRTGESKRLTQLHRARMADPRSASGFKLRWKEIVYPIVTTQSAGAKLRDVDGNEYVDLTMGFGSHLFGYSPPFVIEAMSDQLKQGMEIGPQSPMAGEVAAKLCQFSSLERVTFCNTGSEAMLAALRVARTVTGRDRIAMFTGSYHGINDELLVRAQKVNGGQRLLPVAPGIPQSNADNVLLLDYGETSSLEQIDAQADDLAAVLVEAVQSRRPDFRPREYLRALRELTARRGIALVFDEVITGFRLHPGGSQAWYGIQADLATYGKVLGGGLPIGVVAGKARFMDAFDGGAWSFGDGSYPSVGVTFFAGTFIRHPLALRSALAVLRHLEENGPGLQERLNARADALARELNDCFREKGAPLRLLNCGSMLYLKIEENQPLGVLLYYYLREKGLHIWDGRPHFLSTAHTDEDLEFIARAFRESVDEMLRNGFFSGTDGSPANDGGGGGRRREAPERRVPLTPGQLEIWLEAQKGDQASSRYNESTTLRLQGPCNVPALRQAIQALVDRHEALRARFSPQGDCQEIPETIELEIAWHDLRDWAPAQQAARVEELKLREGRIPFDLAHGPMLRAGIVRLSEGEHLVILTLHHIVCDGWSMSVLLRELGELYTAADQNRSAALRPAAGFSEYVRWQADDARKPAIERSENFWLERLRGAQPVLELPADRPRPAVKGYRGARLNVVFAPKLYRELKQAGARLNATLFATLLAGFEVLLHRLSGQDELLIGVPLAEQPLVDAEALVGHCTNLLPLRSRHAAGMKFRDFLANTRREVMDATEHQHCTLGTLVRRLNLPRDPSRSLLVPVTFNVDRVSAPSNFAGLTAEAMANAKSFMNSDLCVNIRDDGRNLLLECDFNTELYDETTIRRWLRHYQTLLEDLLRDPDQAVSRAALLTAAESEQLLVEWNRTATGYPAKTVAELFEEQAAEKPDAVAVVSGQREITYGELNAQANRLARHLQGLGVGPDKVVAVCLERSPELLVVLLGILKAGGAYAAIEPDSPAQRLHWMLEDARPAVLVVETKEQRAGFEALLAQAENGTPTPALVCLEKDSRALQRNDTGNPECRATPESLAYVCFTSGSTGRPKGVAVTHRGVVRLVRNTNYLSISPLDVFLQFAPVSFDASTFEIWGCLLNGARLVVCPARALSLGELGAVIRKQQVSVLWLTAGLFHQMVDGQLESLKGVRQLLAGGDVLSVPHTRKALEALGEGKLINGYGPTENTTFTCCHPITRASVERASIPIGRPIANTVCHILDRNLQPVPIGVWGELYTGGDGLARGYLNQPELTAEKFVSNPFRPGTLLYRTGDVARYLADGNIEFLGRLDAQVKIRGFRIETGEVEAALRQHPVVRESAVVAREDVAGEKRLVAYYTSRREPGPTTTQLRSFLLEKLPEYMTPSVFVELKAMPLNANGKVDRKALPAPEGKRPELEKVYVAPRDAVETQLTAIWEGLLGVQPVGMRDRFFDLGGHSLLAVRMFAEIERVFGRRIPFTALYQAPTIEELAPLVRERKVAKPDSLLVAIQEKGSKPPLFLIHGAGGGMLWGYTNLAMHLGPEQPVYGIESRGMHGGEEYGRISEMAARYIEEMRAVQPEGPYYLGGYCFGGNIAHEMARQLEEKRERVALLALFEASPFKGTYEHAEWWRPGFACDFAVNLYYWIEYLYQLKPAARWSVLGRRIKSSIRRVGWQLQNLAAQQAPMDLDDVVDISIIPDNELVLWRAHLRAMDEHVSQYYGGSLALFRTKRQPFWCSFNPTYGWDVLTGGGVSVHLVPGAHESIFVEPNVRVTGEKLRRCLEQAQEGGK